MKNILRPPHSGPQSGFSLVEMIGVLAIIAILAVVIVPKVFATIASSRVTNAVGSVTSIKSAVTDFAGKYGTVPLTNANSRIDDLLVTTGLLDSRFVVKIGTQPSSPVAAGAAWTQVAGVWGNTTAVGVAQAGQSRIVSQVSTAVVPNTAAGANFRLDGATNLPTNSRVISAVLVNVTAAEAKDLSLKIDGDAFTQAGLVAADATGKVVYAAPVAGLTTAYIYIAHQ
jgi:prepilin-type N-terminal cleavage/methylation domain-containing protein